jgi:hypothetical protein
MPRFRILGLFCSSLFVACALNAEPSTQSESALLPNDNTTDLDHDGTAYRRIAEAFAARGYDLHVNLAAFAPAWPVNGAKTAAVQRHGTPIWFGGYGYFHSGMSVVRGAGTTSSDVLAPHDGVALAFDWKGDPATSTTPPGATILAIYDTTSHVLTQLAQITPAPGLVGAQNPVPITKGAVVGKLVPYAAAEPADTQRLASTKVVFVDGENKLLLDPAALLQGYRDTIAPQIKSVYLADSAGQVATELSSDDLDIVVEAFDRDSDSARNFEISALAYTVKDQDGNVLASSERCNLADIYASIAEPGPSRAKELIDFGTPMAPDRFGTRRTISVTSPTRTFRYALSNLSVENGRCVLHDDASRAVTVSDKVMQLDVSITAWDAKGNEVTKTTPLLRPQGFVPDPSNSDQDAGDPADPTDGGADPGDGGTDAADGGI